MMPWTVRCARRALLQAPMLAVWLVPVSAAAQTVAADSADVATPEAIVAAMYGAINRPPGENFDWDRMRALFLPTATLIPSLEQTGGELRILSVEEFIAWIDEHTVVGGADDAGFQEEQIASRVEHYGAIAQVFSTYQKRFWGADEILGRGINAISSSTMTAAGGWSASSGMRRPVPGRCPSGTCRTEPA